MQRMEAIGINFGYLFIQLCIVGVIFILPPVLAILQLRKRIFENDTEKLIWVFIIVIAPLIGSLAFFIVKPGVDAEKFST